jgi:hypothetical protein
MFSHAWASRPIGRSGWSVIPLAELSAMSSRCRNGTVRRRFAAGLRNFTDVYRHEVDWWQWFDNSGVEPSLLKEDGIP